MVMAVSDYYPVLTCNTKQQLSPEKDLHIYLDKFSKSVAVYS